LPGWYVVAPMYYRYSADEFRDRNGDPRLAIEGGGSVEATAWLAGVIWVSDHKILGGNYSFSIWPGVTDNALEFPSLGVEIAISQLSPSAASRSQVPSAGCRMTAYGLFVQTMARNHLRLCERSGLW
jgi:hypothetical protein